MAHGVLKKLLLPLFMFVSLVTAAQQDSMGVSKSSKVASFQMLANVGLIAGKSGRDVQVQAIPQMQYRSWIAGVGVGLDYYYWRTVPLFVDVRKTFSKAYAPFLYGDIGWNVPWIKKQKVWYDSHYKTGVYYDVGGGWNFKVNQHNSLLLSSGYTLKKIHEVRTTNFDKTKLDYELRRISIKVGFQF